MFDIPTRRDLAQLASQRGFPSISIFQPTHRGGPETRQDPIRFKDLFSEAQRQIEDQLKHDQELRALVEKTRNLVHDHAFWQHQADGLAYFLSKESETFFRLPLDVPEMVSVGDRFHLKPLLPLIAEDANFFLLAISQQKIRFFRGTRFRFQEIDVPGMPKDMDDALNHEEAAQSLQVATSNFTPSGVPHHVQFHGHGGGDDGWKNKIGRYFRIVDEKLHQILHAESAPLVIAAVDQNQSIFRAASHYPHIFPHGIEGSPDQRKPEELHAEALKVLQPYLERSRQEAEQRFSDLNHTERASDNLERVVGAAWGGRVDSLFVETGRQIPGVFKPQKATIQQGGNEEKPDHDLLDYAAVQTYLNGGKVYALPKGQLPTSSPVAAVFRY